MAIVTNQGVTPTTLEQYVTELENHFFAVYLVLI